MNRHLGAFARFRAAPAEIGGLERIGTNLRVGDGGTVVIQAITGDGSSTSSPGSSTAFMVRRWACCPPQVIMISVFGS